MGGDVDAGHLHQQARDRPRCGTGYEAGTRTIVDVLNVQRNLFQNERDYTNARFDYVLSALRLKQVAGALTEEEILALEQWMAN